MAAHLYWGQIFRRVRVAKLEARGVGEAGGDRRYIVRSLFYVFRRAVACGLLPISTTVP